MSSAAPLREVGSLWANGRQRLKVEVDHGAVIVQGVSIATAAERDYFSRIWFLACAEADDWAREHEDVPP
jgi:hypothetical protein